ncbi:MAG: ribonuclease HI [Caedimonadaceae bacterium]|nr:MAG: ribonuclease HI [Caedimonadaceae bacterium]
MSKINPDEMIEIYTDGACSGNPGPGGWGVLIKRGEKEEELSGSETLTTNNRMELMATISALEYVSTEGSIKLYTDSTYVKDGVTLWLARWKKNDWKTANNKPVKNRDLWERLDQAIKNHAAIEWHWVKAHDGHRENERADFLARNAIVKAYMEETLAENS